MVETIVAAAIRYPVEGFDDMWQGERSYPEHLIVTAPKPARHHSLLHPFIEKTGIHEAGRDQGFMTSTGRFVDRSEAWNIAVAAEQRFLRPDEQSAGTLFSEDLW